MCLSKARIASCVVGPLALLVIAPMALAQSAQADQWQLVLEPYVMFPHITGTVGVGPLPNVALDEDPSDLFKHLQLGAMFYAEAHDNNWAITSDVFYANIAETAPSRPIISYARVDLKQLIWEPDLLFRLSPWFEVGAGADLTSLKPSINLTLNTPLGPISRAGSLSTTWVDPTIVGRATIPLSVRWYLIARGNVGGFDVNSKFTWQAQLYAAYRISDLMTVSFGYRALGDDYDQGSGNRRFLYNTTIFGPVIRYAFTF
jgi:opacity protein-like surface antigen